MVTDQCRLVKGDRRVTVVAWWLITGDGAGLMTGVSRVTGRGLVTGDGLVSVNTSDRDW